MSDPGILVSRKAREAGHDVVPLPGPSAFTALISAAGVFFKGVTFDGFPSVKPGRRRSRVAELMGREDAFVMYESPHRIVKLLGDIADIDSERYVCVGREMTKIYEEFVTGSAKSVLDDFAARQSIKGEFAVLVSPGKKE
jgi:16S rRNA (cytidine1402-2'-O)-methyltransferase